MSTTEEILAAAFGQEAVGAVAPQATPGAAPAPATPAAGGTSSIFVDADPTPTPAAPAPGVAPAAEPAPAATAPAAVDDARTAFLEQQVLALQQAVLAARQTQQAPAAPAAPAAPVYDPATAALTADELVAYKDSLPVIEKVASRLAAQAAQQASAQVTALQAQLEAQAAQLQQLNAGVEHSRNVALVSSVQQMLPQDVNMQAITSSAQWKAHLNSRAPFSGGRTVKQVLEAAVQANDPATIAEFVQAYAASNPPQQRPAPVVAPGATAAPTAVGHAMPARKQAISASAIDQAMADAQAGKLSRDQYDNMLAQAFAAAAGGLDLVQ